MLLPAPTSGAAVTTHSRPARTAPSKKMGELEGGGRVARLTRVAEGGGGSSPPFPTNVDSELKKKIIK